MITAQHPKDSAATVAGRFAREHNLRPMLVKAALEAECILMHSKKGEPDRWYVKGAEPKS